MARLRGGRIFRKINFCCEVPNIMSQKGGGGQRTDAFFCRPMNQNPIDSIKGAIKCMIERKNNNFYFEPVQHLKMFNT